MIFHYKIKIIKIIFIVINVIIHAIKKIILINIYQPLNTKTMKMITMITKK